ncbi:Trypsin-1 [Folsomia candida]|uniref:limulus clotting factor C n=1 Tax=Folsomia candida TaxID=158441 RepID=A0A226F4Q0_FOLCA|nr:Trypsin-1 [Folsomia candida]
MRNQQTSGTLTLCSCMEVRITGNDSSSRHVPDNESRIVGGEEAIPHEFPWLIRIQRKTSQSLVCGGTIIDRNLILTAAHCIGNAKDDANKYEVLGGAHDMNAMEDTRQVRSITRINCHKEFNIDTFQNDICILVLASDLTWTRSVGPIKLANTSSVIPNSGTTAGFGVTVEGSSATSNLLQKVTVPIVSNERCFLLYKEHVEITNEMMCAGISGKDSCQGDSGGGLMCKSQNQETILCGIVSFGAGCGHEDFPGVYSRVSSYEAWISENSASSFSLVPITILTFSTLLKVVTFD